MVRFPPSNEILYLRAMASENERRILQRDTNPHLFRPLKLRGLTVKNRIMMSPMCQYSAEEGVPNDWHFAHIAARAAGGVAIACVEATAVERRGRITYGCMGIWNDAQRDAFKRMTEFVSGQGAIPGIQLAHSGRKGSVSRPWEGTKPLSHGQGAWEVFGPSAVPHGD
jgi:2,4-dienoyl-CoA reductase-like NADH-dependent reductase (Old Yellow Enzyme family)